MSEDTARLTVDRGRRARLAYDEFIQPTIAKLKEAYTKRMGEIVAQTPWETDKIIALTGSIRLVDALADHVRLAIDDGNAAARELGKIETVTSMHAARRKVIGL